MGDSKVRLTRFEPLRVADLLQRDVDRPESVQRSWQPATDVVEYSNSFVLRLDLPGVSAADIDISMDQGVLLIAGERRMPELGDDASLKRQERVSGRFERRFTLPKTIDADNVSAQSRDGILEVTIPKAAEVQPRKITVEAA